MDAIRVTGIRAYGYTGFLAEERRLGQWFETDLTLWLDLAPAAASDDIERTLDYRQTIAAVQQIIRTRQFLLVERLAAEIADTILRSQPVEQVQVGLAKPAPPIADFDGQIAIDITRARSALPAA